MCGGDWLFVNLLKHNAKEVCKNPRGASVDSGSGRFHAKRVFSQLSLNLF